MNHLFRLVCLLITAPFAKKISFEEHSVTKMRVWPTDLDPLMHMNNGVYLSLLDLGRIDFMIKTGGIKEVRKRGIYPVVASEGIKFQKSLKPFQNFEIRTKLSGWDNKFVYLEQSYWSKKELYASALIKGIFLKKKGGKVDIEELKEIMGYEGDLAPKDHVFRLFESIEKAHTEAKD